MIIDLSLAVCQTVFLSLSCQENFEEQEEVYMKLTFFTYKGSPKYLESQ